MIKGIGTDLIEISRVQRSLAKFGDKFAERILAPSELAEYSRCGSPERFVAKRWAAKEAAGKALGTGIGQGVSWQDFCVEHTPLGAPQLVLSGKAAEIAAQQGVQAMAISISDERHYAIAFVVFSTT